MSMHIIHMDKQEIRLQADSQGYFIVILGLLAGLIGLLVGSVLIFWYGPWFVYGIGTCLLSLLFAAVPALVFRAANRDAFSSIVFRAADASVHISIGTVSKPDIRLGFDGLRVEYRASSGSSASSASRSVGDERAFYDLYLVLPEAASMLLLENIYGREKAQSLQHSFAAMLDTQGSGPAEQPLAQSLPEWLELRHSAEESILRYSNRASVASPWALALFFLFFFGVLTTFYLKSPDELFVHLVLGFIGGVGLLVLGMTIAQSRKKSSVQSELRLGSTELVFNDISDGQTKEVQRVALSETAFFGFAPYNIGSGSDLYLLTREALASAQDLATADDSIAAWKQNLKQGVRELGLLRQLAKIVSSGRSLSDMLLFRSVLNTILLLQQQGQQWHPTSVSQQSYMSARYQISASELLKSPAFVGSLGILSATVPLISLVLSIGLYDKNIAGQLLWMFTLLNILQLASVGILCQALLRTDSLRILGIVLLVLLIHYAFNLLGGIELVPIGLGFQLFALCVLTIVGSWRLLAQPRQTDHERWT